jgi:hypothetical protein
MTRFDPSAFKFVRLRDFAFPGGVSVYEYANRPQADGKADFRRINAYLSRDGGFVTVWHGLLEPLCAEARVGFVDVLEGFDFRESYTGGAVQRLDRLVGSGTAHPQRAAPRRHAAPGPEHGR